MSICFVNLSTCYLVFLGLSWFIMIALAGHKFAQIPQRVQDEESKILGLQSVPDSKTPKGQTPTQISPEQEEHLL
jgi:hypothetical protein